MAFRSMKRRRHIAFWHDDDFKNEIRYVGNYGDNDNDYREAHLVIYHINTEGVAEVWKEIKH